MNMMARLRVAAAVCGTLVLISCGGGGGGGSAPDPNAAGNVNVTGLVGGAAPAMGRIAAQAAGTPDRIWAIPITKMQGSQLDPINILLREVAMLDASGNFELSLGKSITAPEVAAVYPGLYNQGFSPDDVFEVDWILVLMDGTTPVGTIELSDATNGLINLPISAFSSNSLDVGSVDPSTGAATTTVGSLATNVTLSAAQLLTIAKLDDMFKALEDLLRNCDFSVDPAVCVSGRLSHAFQGDHDLAAAGDNRATSYGGYQIYFDLADKYDDSEFASLCAIGSATPGDAAGVEYRLTPPGNVTAVEGSVPTVFNATTPMQTGDGLGTVSANGSGVDCFKNSTITGGSANVGIYVRDDSAGVDGSDWLLQFVTGDQDLISGNPSGFWTLERRTDPATSTVWTSEGQFRYEFSSPVDTNSNPKIFIPSLRVDTDANSQITSLTIKWWEYDGSGFQPANVALLNNLLGGFGISVDDFDGTTGNGGSRRSASANGLTFATQTVLDLTPANIATTLPDDSATGGFKYSCSIDPDSFEALYIGIDYSIAGQGLRFVWRC